MVLLSDHGFHLGEKLHWQKATLWEEATHCLLMIREPGMKSAGTVCRRFVSLLDVYPTIAELCGLSVPDSVTGRSLVPLLEQPDKNWASTAITAFGNQYVSYRNARFRYIRYDDDQEELYDMVADPRQWQNLALKPSSQIVIENMRRAVPRANAMAKPVPSKRRRR